MSIKILRHHPECTYWLNEEYCDCFPDEVEIEDEPDDDEDCEDVDEQANRRQRDWRTT